MVPVSQQEGGKSGQLSADRVRCVHLEDVRFECGNRLLDPCNAMEHAPYRKILPTWGR